MKMLVKYSGDWADEFNCEEFCIMESKEAFDAWIAKIQSHIDNNQTEFYFGTNECNTFKCINDLINCLEVSNISDEEADVFNKYFGDRSFGTSGVFSIDSYDPNEYE